MCFFCSEVRLVSELWKNLHDIHLATWSLWCITGETSHVGQAEGAVRCRDRSQGSGADHRNPA
jgi:hypothetical protein